MSQICIRKSPPDCLRLILRFLYKDRKTSGDLKATIEQLVQVLSNANYNKSTATEAIYNAVQDGLLVPFVKSPRGGSARKRLAENSLLRLPELNEVPIATHDYYCFECHLPGILEFCKQCPRSFHRICFRKDAERPNYIVPSAKQQKNPLPAFSSETDSNSEDNDDLRCAESTIPDCESDLMRASSSLQAIDQLSIACFTPQHLEECTIDSTSSPVQITTSNAADNSGNILVEGKPQLSLDAYMPTMSDTKTKLEVVCLGEVRPPNRKRNAAVINTSNISYKSEVTQNDDDLDFEELCTCCRLLKSAETRNPPNMESDELCHLLNYTFSRNRSWIAQDVLSYLEILKLNAKERNIVAKLLFKVTPLSLDMIATKLRKKKYTFIMQFLVDILDVQHNIGVLFGRYSTALDSTKYFIRDIVHDLAEIRRCPDCFRYSHEKDSNIWFAKPCVQRHELVFAKHSGFPYWPAKVIRVLPNNKYDVRFFGGKHSRALIDVKFIKPIDSDSKQLKFGKSLAVKKALEELRYHQILSTYPPSKFAFHADKNETANIISDVLGRANTQFNVALEPVKNVRIGRKRRSTIMEINDIDEDDSWTASPSKRQSEVLIAGTNKHMTRSKLKSQESSICELKKIQEELASIKKIAQARENQIIKLRSQLQSIKETLSKYEIEKKILKRKQWCYWCLKEAIYLCCFKASYCSSDCQSRHWVDGHSKVCKNKDNHREN